MKMEREGGESYSIPDRPGSLESLGYIVAVVVAVVVSSGRHWDGAAAADGCGGSDGGG